MRNIYTFSVWGPWTCGGLDSYSHDTVTSAMLLFVLTVYDQNVTRKWSMYHNDNAVTQSSYVSTLICLL